MDNQIRMGGFSILPIGVKNLLIINVLLFFATVVFQRTGMCDLNQWLGLHFVTAPFFKPWQFVTYMFMHGNFNHLFLNMFALWMFGATIENYWGTKRFLIYYFVTGIGAALVHYFVTFLQIQPMLVLFNQFLDSPSLETFRYLAENNVDIRFKGMFDNNLLFLQQNPGGLNDLVRVTADARDSFLNSFNIIGASGAVYGVLLAFGMMFPNDYIYIYFLLPLKAKWFVVLYVVIELVSGLTTSDGIAHFAHLGGMLFGLILILIWRKSDRHRRQRNSFYDYYEPQDDGRGFFSRCVSNSSL